MNWVVRTSFTGKVRADLKEIRQWDERTTREKACRASGRRAKAPRREHAEMFKERA